MATSVQDHGVSTTVLDPPQGPEVTEPAKPWKKTDSDQAWEKVVKVMTEYDDKMVERWKEELSNLLVFVRHFAHPSVILRTWSDQTSCG